MNAVTLQALSVFEHQRVVIAETAGPDRLSAAEAARLVSLSEERPGFCTMGNQSLRVAQYAGLVGMGSRVLEILPKVEVGEGDVPKGRGIFLRLLRLATHLKMHPSDHASQDLRHQSLLEVFISAYLESVSQLVRTGLMRRYQQIEEDLNLIRGRLRLERQASTLALRHDRLACRYDELSADNAWNQVLKTALHAVKPWISSIDLGRRRMELFAAFDEVSLRTVAPAEIDVLVFDRQAARYQTAIDWAGCILRLLSPNLRAGHNDAQGLVFDMNQLFEAAMLKLLRQRASLRCELRVEGQAVGRHLATVAGDTREAFRLRPDIVIRRDEECMAVADTKWCRLEMDSAARLKPSEAHVYQMHAYASVYPCEDFSLIYPWHSGLAKARPTSFDLPRIGDRQPRLHIATVDVGSDGFEYHLSVAGSALTDLLGGRFGIG